MYGPVLCKGAACTAPEHDSGDGQFQVGKQALQIGKRL